MSERRLGRDVFLALAAIGWADGKLDLDEADAIVRTALEEGLELEEISEIEAATKNPVELESLDASKMSLEDRLFVYAVGIWMAGLDGITEVSERKVLEKFGSVLKLTHEERQQAAAAAKDVAALEEGDRPLGYDLPRLRKALAERLHS
jgi:tellurite resistance protein